MTAPSNPNRRVLIVEDDEATREAFALILSRAGYLAHTAADGQAALDLLNSEQAPGVIVLDLMMPGMDGYQFRRLQKADRRFAGIPVIICSASGELPVRLGDLVGADFLAKPIDPSALVKAVARYC